MIDDRKALAIQYLADGQLPKTEIAKKLGIARQTIYEWLDNVEFKAELDKRLQQRKVLVEKIIDGKLENAVDSLFELAETTDNARVKAQVLQYIIDRGLGKPVAKHHIEAANNNAHNVSDDILDAEFEEWEVEE
ncbi:helix-turn-helix domain-containing protein [Sutcliffiella horikoshii]|uniref:helix-turn-helix domain-containing protein n=1 Tax=Sutcliffiella horikoshii TaxID=79883 RepID=UPI00384F9025